MEEKGKISTKTIQTLINLLNKSLRFEYNFIIHYPRVAQMVQDEEARKLILDLCTDSIQHSDVVANVITHLGGKPDWSFDLLPEGMDILEMLQIQLEKEKQALQLHQTAVNLIPSGPHGNALQRLVDDEKDHILAVDRIIERLKQA